MTRRYDVVTTTRLGKTRTRRYATGTPLAAGHVIRLDGRDWLVERIEPSGDGRPDRAAAKPARYRVRLVHPDGHEELWILRRWRPDLPGLGHGFTTLAEGRPAVWSIVDVQIAQGEDGEPYLDLSAERDYGEADGELPVHELEYALIADATLTEAAASLARADEAGAAVELVSLDPGEEPDWQEAGRYIDSLIYEEIEDDLFEQCGVDTEVDPPETWLATVRARLHADLDRFRADVDGSHDHIEEWEFRDGRGLASIGRADDEADPDAGHGWMCRLVDASALGAAGVSRVRKAQLQAS